MTTCSPALPPSVAPRSADLDDALHQLVRADQPRRRLRRPLRLAVGVGAAAGILGVGVAGAAAVMHEGGALWFTTTGSGDACEMEFDVTPVGSQDVGNGEPATVMEGRTAWPSAAEQQEVAQAARLFLADYDYDAVDRESAIRGTDAAQRRIIAGAAPGEAQPLDTGDDLEMHAVSRVVVRDLHAHLEGLGMDPSVVVYGVGSSSGCSE